MKGKILFSDPKTYPPIPDLLKCSDDEMKEIFREYEFVGYHVTKLLDKMSVEENGIRCSIEWYYETLFRNLLIIGLTEYEAQEAIGMVKKRYREKYFEREYSCCFYSILGEEQKEYADGHFAANIGGELFQQGIGGETSLFKKVSSFGTRYVITTTLLFDDLLSFVQNEFVYKFREYANGQIERVEIDLMVQRDIPAERLAISEYDDYFANFK